MVERQVAAFLYVRMYHHQEVVIPESLAGYPTVLVDGSCADPRVASVVPNDLGGAAAAVRELVDHGHTGSRSSTMPMTFRPQESAWLESPLSSAELDWTWNTRSSWPAPRMRLAAPRRATVARTA